MGIYLSINYILYKEERKIVKRKKTFFSFFMYKIRVNFVLKSHFSAFVVDFSPQMGTFSEIH